MQLKQPDNFMPAVNHILLYTLHDLSKYRNRPQRTSAQLAETVYFDKMLTFSKSRVCLKVCNKNTSV